MHIVFKDRSDLQMHQAIITKHRKTGINAAKASREIPVVTLVCAGGCNKLHRVRATKLRTGNVFICNDKDSREGCKANMPRVVDGKVRVIRVQQAGKLSGVTWEDQGKFAALKAHAANLFDNLTRLGMKKD